MAHISLSWTDNNASETSHRVYRAYEPFDAADLPEPLAILGANATSYMDTTFEPGQTVYYRVAAEQDGVLAVSDLATVSLGGDLPHRYCRVDVGSAQNNWLDIRVGEIELRSAPGGANLPTTVGGSATASHEYYPAARAFDGLITTNANDWIASGSKTAYIIFDFGEGNEQVVTQCTLKNTNTGSSAEEDQHALNYAVSYSDSGSTWVLTGLKFGHPREANASSTLDLSGAFADTGHLDYRLYITANNGDSSYTEIGEFELLDADGYDLTSKLLNSATSSSNYGGQGPHLAIDDNISSSWITAGGAATPSWLRVGLGIAGQAVAFSIRASTSLPARTPKDFVLQGSRNGGASWVDLKTVTGETAWAAGERRVFTIP